MSGGHGEFTTPAVLRSSRGRGLLFTTAPPGLPGDIEYRFLGRHLNLIGKFHLDPQATGAMPLSADSSNSPGKASFDGVALAIILPKAMLQPGK